MVVAPPGALRSFPAPYRTVNVANLLLQFTPQYGPLFNQTEVVPFGYIRNGKQKMGSLRDKDVLHLKGEGRLVTNKSLSGCSAITYLPSGTSATMGYAVTTNGFSGNAIPVPMGENVTLSMAFSFTPYTATGIGPIQPGPMQCTVSVRWGSGGKFVVETGVMPSSYIKTNTGERIATPGQAGAFWGEINPTTGARRKSASYSCTWTELDSSPGYNIPGVPGVPFLSLSPDPSVYKINYVSNNPWSIVKTHVVGGASAIVDSSMLVDWIASPATGRWVYNQLCTHIEPFDVGELGSDIIRGQRHVDANLLLTAFDLIRLKSDIKSWKLLSRSLTKSAKKISSGMIKTFADLQRWLDHMGKSVASAYLGVEYGILPTMRDGQAVMKGLGELSSWPTEPDRRHARRTVVSETRFGFNVESTHTLTVESSSLPHGLGGNVMAKIRSAKEWGLWPNFSSLWDFVPYSFVYDWFTDAMSAPVTYGDTVVDSLYFPVSYCIISVRRRFSPAVECWVPRQWGVIGQVTFSFYDRSLTRSLPLPSKQTGDGESSQFNHWGEAAALIIQRRN